MRIPIGLVAVFLSAGGAACAQTIPGEPLHDSGTSITGAFEGWFKKPDGGFGLLLGYFNRNQKTEVDIPIGPNNSIEPGGPDHGQPTHFYPGRQYGMFVINVPADFNGKFTWTIVANGMTTVIPASLKTEYEISPFIEESGGNTPPVLNFEENGPKVQGPLGLNIQRTASVGVPLTLNAWVADDGKWTTLSGAPPRGGLETPVTLHWTRYRGPDAVKFSADRPRIEKTPGSAFFNGKSSVTATFSAPGDYILHLVVNDLSGDGGGEELCCWTFGTVHVTVR